MASVSEPAVTKYYQVSITFHAFEDVEFYYLVEATDSEGAKKEAINKASEHLYVKQVNPIGNGTFEVVINYNRFKEGNKYYTISAASAEQAGHLAKQQAKKCFTAVVIFHETIQGDQ